MTLLRREVVGNEPPQRVRRYHVLPNVPLGLFGIIEVQVFVDRTAHREQYLLPVARDLDARYVASTLREAQRDVAFRRRRRRTIAHEEIGADRVSQDVAQVRV